MTEQDVAPEPEAIEGERGTAAVHRRSSLQSRMTNYLAMALIGSMVLGLMGWYYVRTFSNRTTAQDTAQAKTKNKAEGETTLPPLGRIEPPSPVLESVLGPAPEEPPPDDIPDAWLQPAVEPQAASRSARAQPPTPDELALKRKLGGAVLVSQRRSATVASPDVSDRELAALLGAETDAAAATNNRGELDGLLRPTTTPAALAQRLPTQSLLLAKGAALDCTLLTAIDSTLPGLVTCVTATDTFSQDGKVVLLERGTQLVGETRGQVQRGSARILVLWTEARTPPPNGVVIPLASPGTDELGRSGLPGRVNRHFFERFGAAILISMIDGAIEAEVQSRNDGQPLVYDPSTSEDIATEVLKSTVNIPPTVTKPQGDRIQVMVARDLDFRSVYELRPVASGR